MATQTNKAMTSEVSICNQALGWLGEKPINALNENTVSAELCRENYPFLRDAVLEKAMWNFAIARAKSADVVEKDDWDTLFKHAIPLEWLQVYRVYRSISGRNYLPADQWVVEEGYVLSNESTIYLYGVKRITDTGKFSNLFVQCLAARIAADLCITITENRTLQADLWALYEEKLSDAMVRDGQQGRNEKLRARVLHNARGMGGGGLPWAD